MALAPSVHIATQKLSITLKISELFFTSRQLLTESKFLLQLILVDKSQKNLKAERRLTHRWIHLIVVQNNLPSGGLRLVVPSHQLRDDCVNLIVLMLMQQLIDVD